MRDRADFVILGAGVAGLAAASELGDRAILFEQDERPGGLVRTDCIDGYWFDHVLHLLHFQDDLMKQRMRALLGDDLVPVNPNAYVETMHGVARFPIQLHLAGLNHDATAKCLNGLVRAAYDPHDAPAANYEDMLLRSFGRELCEVFFFPYNRKQWKRPLDTLAPSGFQWNIARPDLESAIRGAVDRGQTAPAYNANGMYPRPAGNAVRGMEVVSRALAATVPDLRLQHRVTRIEPEARRVVVTHNGRDQGVHYDEACIATLPLPALVGITDGVPARLRDACSRLLCNRVLNVMIRMRGPRPQGRGFWRYYTDESLCFTRLIYLHEFDPLSAPSDGWGLMAEIVEPAEWPAPDIDSVRAVIQRDLARAGALPADCEILGIDVRVIDTAYVVFTRECKAVVDEAVDHLRSRGVIPLGRYGRWEYSSMAQVMRDGYAIAAAYRHPDTEARTTA